MPLKPSFAQLGDAVEPQLHRADAAAPVDRDHVSAGEFPADESPLGRWVWRLSGQMVAPDNRAPAHGDGGLDTVAEHQSHGEPDRRRQYDALTPAGYPVALPRVESSPTQIRSEPHGSVSIPGVSGLTVNKAGSTSADYARPAGMNRWLFDRPFDQWAAHHPPEVSKLPMPSPLAGNPIRQTIPTPGAVPAPGGVDGVTVMESDQIHRNTVRMVPTPWDQSAVVGSDVQPFQARRWRL
ncbi:hypothetical protein ACFV4G_39685 [Kitasatospora sp. NPDC059747]|uniref:hypothetical protein n=1 Tax=Kitasatospora sp. NPDC059747 TaxID=3346930 RepID=UPI0036677523